MIDIWNICIKKYKKRVSWSLLRESEPPPGWQFRIIGVLMSGSISSIDSSDLGNFYIVLLNESYKNVTGEKREETSRKRGTGTCSMEGWTCTSK